MVLIDYRFDSVIRFQQLLGKLDEINCSCCFFSPVTEILCSYFFILLLLKHQVVFMWLNLYSIFIYVSTFYAIFMVYWFSLLNLNYYFIVSKSEISLLEKWAMAFRWLVLLFPHLSSHFYAFSWFFRQFPLNQNWYLIVSKCAKSLLRTGWHLSPFNGLQHYRCFIYLEQCQLFLTKLPPLLIQRPLVASWVPLWVSKFFDHFGIGTQRGVGAWSATLHCYVRVCSNVFLVWQSKGELF